MALTTKQISFIQSQLESKRKTVSFDSYDLSVRQILDMVESGDVFVPPEYQRQFIWDAGRQSVLIESVFLGIPVPSLFMATNPDSTWEVVDGVQRLGSLSHFVGSVELLDKIQKNEPLVLKGLEKLDYFNGIKFQDLPKSIQLQFLTRPIRVTVLNDRSDLAVRFDLFERLNTGGVSLTPQEIRNCVYRGQFNDDIKELASRPSFRSVVKVQDGKGSNGTYEELVLRFFAYLDNYNKFNHIVKDFLNEYMNDRRHMGLSAKDKQLFEQMVAVLHEAFPKGISRGRGTTPANLYEAFSVGVALAIKGGKVIDAKKSPP
ncbi:DUF262 domain-containing protein [Pseudomonas sp. PD9R]|uniref:GmrSD restriction endonuclease domain-containing protein n=1 Tax=Pseudomonas sp. PD9R TaxID=2853534 RepID=UPI00210E1A02|nr:DUF262 domain-containing protein [Pseudomonas sp. PD9R]